MDDREDLPNISLAGGTQYPNVTSQDEADLSTLVRVQAMLEDALVQYRGVETLDMTESELSVKEQIKVHQVVVTELSLVKDAIDTAIDGVIEKNKGEEE